MAVAVVIINHFNPNILPGGYLGVDIFFVISGYVITSSLSSRSAEGFGDFLGGFYARRIKRLLPALALFALVMNVLICLFADPFAQDRPALRTAISSLIGISNLYLYKQSTDYFDQSTELNPLSHTWSLGVEEQFYLLFPLLIWFSGFGRQAKNGARNLFLWMVVLTIASLTGFIYLYQNNQPAAYFLMPSRFWEIAVGCLLFIGFQKWSKMEQNLGQLPAFLVVIAMLAVMFLPISAAVPATVAIVALSALLLACLKKETIAYSLFTHKTVVYIGLMSYSLYLWHWGVLSISRWTIGIHWWSVPFQVAVMLILAFSSYKWIETPARTSRWIGTIGKNFRLVFLVFFVSALSLTGLSRGFYRRLYVGHYPHENLMTQPRDYAKGQIRLKPNYSSSHCHLGRLSKHLPVNCTIASKRNQTFFFMGDSHADHYRETHYLLAKNDGISVDGITVSACIFPPAAQPYDCSYIQSQREKQVLHRMKPGDVAVIANRYHVDDDSLGWLKTATSIASIHTFANKVFAKGGKLIVFAPSPEYPLESRLCLRLWFRPHPPDGCASSIKRMRSERRQAYALMKTLDKRIILYDPIPALCINNGCTMIDAQNKPLLRDKHHLSDHANREYVYPSFRHFLRINQLI